ncbi:spermidine synthase [Lutzomyia longipalpis]|uniref:Spermidine synthase n=1 Tax=Lutzomyia longipalpis TaxID=7200 RepID=A0A1B0CK51_LUTLO|nr:spermidine synthase [Lutzomyia longipalpis]
MDFSMKNWFSEVNELWPGQSMSLKVKKLLWEEKSPFQHIQIFESETYGRVLALDGIIQCTERDEFAYQEMISFLPLCCHPEPKKVLIVGGGDGGVAREVVKHPLVQEVCQVEIDERVVELSKEYLPFMACGFTSPKLTLTIGDGFDFMKNHVGEFDVIITDSSDPVGPAVCLFQESYFSLMKCALRPGGIVCSQGGTYWTEMNQVKDTLTHCRSQFPVAGYAYSSVPTYPCGQIGYVIGSLNENTNLKEPTVIFSEEELEKMGMRYYSADIHRAAFTLPRYAANVLK